MARISDDEYINKRNPKRKYDDYRDTYQSYIEEQRLKYLRALQQQKQTKTQPVFGDWTNVFTYTNKQKNTPIFGDWTNTMAEMPANQQPTPKPTPTYGDWTNTMAEMPYYQPTKKPKTQPVFGDWTNVGTFPANQQPTPTPTPTFGDWTNLYNTQDIYAPTIPKNILQPAITKKEQELKVAQEVIDEKRAGQYQLWYKDINNLKDYYKYVYDTDNPNTKLTSRTRYIDGMPIEMYTWHGLDGMLNNFATPRGWNLPGEIHGGYYNVTSPWSNAQLPIPVNAAASTGEVLPDFGYDGNYIIEEPGYGAYPEISFGGGGGGGGGGYYGNQGYQEALKHYNNLVKWVI